MDRGRDEDKLCVIYVFNIQSDAVCAAGFDDYTGLEIRDILIQSNTYTCKDNMYDTILISLRKSAFSLATLILDSRRMTDREFGLKFRGELQRKFLP